MLVLEQHDINNFSRKGETQYLTDTQTHVLVYPVVGGYDNQALANILDAGLNRPRTVLIQSPFDLDVYVEATEAIEKFALAKHMFLSNFCQLLGATRVSVTQMDIVTNSNVQTLKANGGRLVASAEVSVERTADDSLCSQLNLVDEYAGGNPDVEAAEKLLRSTRLSGDPNMRSLLQARKAVGNSLIRRTLTVNLSTEANKNLKVIGRLNLPTATFGVEYAGENKQTKEYRLTLEVLFPGAPE
ncbi:hypothetical protein IP70_08380 [alpha proteobacterium AAP38]|nr:hypothetical protein IP70_08380 [alpha proteobacterium AAP38]